MKRLLTALLMLSAGAASALKNLLFSSRERSTIVLPAGVNSVADALAVPCVPSTAPVVTR